MKITLLLLVFGLIAFAIYVRVAPSDTARWHVDPLTASDPGRRGVLTTLPLSIAEFDAVASAKPRVERLAGSLEEGRITYVVRSRLWGFPDYITVAQDGDRCVVLSRLRFGGSDLGVNKARLEDWF